jgi:hypothetical protein
MLERIEHLPGGVLGFRLAGPVTAAEYRDRLVRPLREALAGGTKLNLYVELDDDFGLDLGAMWEDVKTAGSGLGHRSACLRLAEPRRAPAVRAGRARRGGRLGCRGLRRLTLSARDGADPLRCCGRP